MTELSNRKLRLGIVGGGSPTSIGPSHVRAARLDGHWELSAGAFSRDLTSCKAAATGYLIDPDRAYGSYAEMAKRESERTDGIDAVTVCTHDETHFEIVEAFLSCGIHVFCDKPLAVSLDQARKLVALAEAKNLILAITYTYAGYAMVHAARQIIADETIGRVLAVDVEYMHQFQAENSPREPSTYDPAASDRLNVVAALGSHAFQMAEAVSGLKVCEVAAQLSGLRNTFDDHANVLLRFEGGQPGSLRTTTVSYGNANGLAFHVTGTEGTVSWHQEKPEHLRLCQSGQPKRTLTRGGPGVPTITERYSRLPEGHPEGYLEAFANIYTGVARAILSGVYDPAVAEYPVGDHGLRGVAFMSAVLTSARAGSAFVPVNE